MNNTEWRQQFFEASAAKDRDKLHALRQGIFQDTVKLVKADPKLLKVKPAQLYASPPAAVSPPVRKILKTVVVEADCIEAARLLLATGQKPVVLNMANRQKPGGGVLGGAGAQEENLFRRSNLFASLFPFEPGLAAQFGLPSHPTDRYPLDQQTGGCFSPEITFFRSSETTGYSPAIAPAVFSVVSVPAINRPDLVQVGREFRIAPSMVEPTRQKIRTIFRILIAHGYEVAVLSAFGCGAFRNPPGHVAELFAEILEEKEFEGHFSTLVFAIIDDHNSGKDHNPEGNVWPFQRVFG